MNAGRRTVQALLVASTALAAGVAAASAAPASVSVRGVEVAASSTVGRFAGEGRRSGGARVAWEAVVEHTPLRRNPAAITGGSFRMATLSRGPSAGLVRGAFTDGTITRLSQAPGCGAQVYAVRGTLATHGRRIGTLNVELKHYRRHVLGRCVAYAASVAGTLSLA